MRKKLLLFLAAALLCAFTAKAQRRADAAQYSKYIKAVDEYRPAPGQFTNVYPEYADGDNAASMATKCTEQIAANAQGLISLGGFGGYVTFHFDHSIANISGKNDFYIMGNASKALIAGYTETGGSSEPGIVMVSRDDNNNGLPDDQWYELSGSADVDSVGKVTYNYEITYTYSAMNDVPWTDSKGRTGTIVRNSYHQQEYFPLWLTAEGTLTFSGTLLPNNGVNINQGDFQWVQMFMRNGYVDNKPNNDSIANSFNIEWAVDANRQPVNLDRIDFVRIYTGMNQMCGWLGETSTEVRGAEDLHLDESIAYATGISTPHNDKANIREVARYAADGRRISSPCHGLNIIKMSDGSVIKHINK